MKRDKFYLTVVLLVLAFVLCPLAQADDNFLVIEITNSCASTITGVFITDENIFPNQFFRIQPNESNWLYVKPFEGDAQLIMTKNGISDGGWTCKNITNGEHFIISKGADGYRLNTERRVSFSLPSYTEEMKITNLSDFLIKGTIVGNKTNESFVVGAKDSTTLSIGRFSGDGIFRLQLDQSGMPAISWTFKNSELGNEFIVSFDEVDGYTVTHLPKTALSVTSFGLSQ
jgi:hypothetical protein